MLKSYVCIQGKALSTNKSCFCFCKYGFGEDKYVSVIPRFFYCLFLYTKSTKRKNNKFSLYFPLLFAVGKRPKKKQLIYFFFRMFFYCLKKEQKQHAFFKFLLFFIEC